MENYHSHHKVSLLGFIIIFLIFGLLVGWMVIAKVDLTIKAPGEIIVKSYKKTIAHPRGGIIEKIYIKEGDFVNKGDKLIKIKSDQLVAQLNATKSNYIHLLAQKDRILAELNNKKPTFEKNIPQNIKENEILNYKIRTSNLKETINNFKIQIEEQKETVNSLKESLKTKQQLLNSYEKEYTEKEALYQKGLIEKTKILDLSRKITQLKGDIENIKSQIVQKESLIKELKNKISLTKINYKKELIDKLQQINKELPNLKSRIAVLKDEIQNNIIKAPSKGIITDMQVHSAGELIKPNSPILYIVPKTSKYLIEVKISPTDIDKVKVGEKADVQFPSYVDPAAKPIEAKVIYVSADIIKNQREAYYKALLEFTPKGLRAIEENNFKIIPGMPVVAFIKAGKRSFMSYILLPIEQLFKGAFHAN